MKKSLFIIITIAIGLLSACEIDTSDNGDFDGLWHMEQVDTIDTGGRLNISQERRFWAVQNKLLNVRDNDKDNAGYLMRFVNADGKIVVYEPYTNTREEGDIMLTDPTPLAPYGINALRDTFFIDRLNGSHMTLRSKKVVLTFNKL